MPQIPDQFANRLAGHGANGHPMAEAVLIDTNLRRISQRIVNAQLLDETAIAGAAPVGGHNTIEGNFLAAAAGESNGD